MSKWFDAVSSNFKMEANATDFDSIHHVAAAFYDMHHRTAHLSAVDDEFSDTFFHIATQPSHVPIFSASESIFNAHELSFVMHMVSADALHSGLRVNIDAQKLNVLTPPYVYGQINMQGPNPENLGAHGDHLPHAAMQGEAVTRDDHRGGAPHHVSSFVRLVCALEGPVWCWAVQGGLGRMLCENDTFYRSIFSPGTSGFVNLARNTVHVDRVFRPSTTPDPVRDGRPWFECTSGDANNVSLDVSPYFLPYGDISIHGVAYASVNNSRAHTPPAQRLTPTVDVSVGCLAALDVEFHVALSGGTSRGRSSGFLLVHGGVHSDRCALSGPVRTHGLRVGCAPTAPTLSHNHSTAVTNDRYELLTARYDRYYAVSTVTSPSAASMHTPLRGVLGRFAGERVDTTCTAFSNRRATCPSRRSMVQKPLHRPLHVLHRIHLLLLCR